MPVGSWLEGEIQAAGLSFREAGRQLQASWTGEPAGAKRLVRVLAGLDDKNGKQLAAEWE